MLFQLRDRDTLEITNVYAVEKDGDRTLFLIYSDDKKDFVWNDSSYFEPV